MLRDNTILVTHYSLNKKTSKPLSHVHAHAHAAKIINLT